MTIKLLPKGHLAARYVMALAAGRGQYHEAAAFAAGNARWRAQTPEIERAFMAAVDPGTTADSTWAAPLVRDVEVDYAELVREASIPGRLPGVRRVPMQTRYLDQSAVTVSGWVGSGKPIPFQGMDFVGSSLPRTKVGSGMVLSEELVMSSKPDAEQLVAREIARACGASIDSAFIDPANGGDDDTPAAITSGMSGTGSSGAALAQIDGDLDALINELADAGSTLEFCAWVMRSRTATFLARLRGTGGALAYPSVTARGGTLLGFPVIVSNNIPVGDSTGNPTSICLIDGGRVTLADEGGGEISVARQASVQLSDEPATGASQMISLWQNHLAAVKLARYMNWSARTGQAAAVLTEVTY